MSFLDNLSTHKPKRDIWLKRHKNVHFHYTPTHASIHEQKQWSSTAKRHPNRQYRI